MSEHEDENNDAALEFLWSEYEKQANAQTEYEKSSMLIIPKPGFVVKTWLQGTQTNPQAAQLPPDTKVFVNICSHSAIAPPSEEQGDTPDDSRLRVPMSCGPLYMHEDHNGAPSLVCDVIFNPSTVEMCRNSADKYFRTYIVQFAIENIQQKHKITCNPDIKFLNNVLFKGPTAPASQRIRKPAAATSTPPTSSSSSSPGANPASILPASGTVSASSNKAPGSLIEEVQEVSPQRTPAAQVASTSKHTQASSASSTSTAPKTAKSATSASTTSTPSSYSSSSSSSSSSSTHPQPPSLPRVRVLAPRFGSAPSTSSASLIPLSEYMDQAVIMPGNPILPQFLTISVEFPPPPTTSPTPPSASSTPFVLSENHFAVDVSAFALRITPTFSSRPSPSSSSSSFAPLFLPLTLQFPFAVDAAQVTCSFAISTRRLRLSVPVFDPPRFSTYVQTALTNVIIPPNASSSSSSSSSASSPSSSSPIVVSGLAKVDALIQTPVLARSQWQKRKRPTQLANTSPAAGQDQTRGTGQAIDASRGVGSSEAGIDQPEEATESSSSSAAAAEAGFSWKERLKLSNPFIGELIV